MTKNNVYKILRAKEWSKASDEGQIITELDRQDGIIHLSTATQLPTTLSLFFDDPDLPYLLQLDLDKLDFDKLLFEESSPNTGKRKSVFSHLYSELMTNQISNVWVIEREVFKLPEEVLLQGENIY